MLKMSPNKCKVFKSQDLHFGQSIDKRMDLLDVINTSKEVMQIVVFKQCVNLS